MGLSCRLQEEEILEGRLFSEYDNTIAQSTPARSGFVTIFTFQDGGSTIERRTFGVEKGAPSSDVLKISLL